MSSTTSSSKYELVTDYIRKPKNDLKEYKFIKLKENKLEILFVYDPQEGKSAAAVNVNAGSLQDPIHRQGIAHFLEHMLFLGTEKHPDADFDAFLNENSGNSNAYTDYMHTNYYFECANSAFREALDRFGNFFIKPLFNKDLVDREMNAVNSEHSKNLQDDGCRKEQLFAFSSLPESPLNKFGTGSLETLKHDSIRDDLIKFYNENYSSNLMKVCIYTHEKIADIEDYVVDLFEQIPNTEIPPPTYPQKPFPNEVFSSLWKYVPIKNGHSVKIMWATDYFSKKSYNKHPAKYWTHIFGFEGQYSLLSALKHLGLAESLYSSYDDVMDNMSIFNVEIDLTDEGYKQLELVMNITFAYLKLMKEKGTAFYVFEEDRLTGEQDFECSDQDDSMEYSHLLTSNMQQYAPVDVIKGLHFLEEFDAELIKNVINSFTADNMRIFISSPELAAECTETEVYYQSKFKREPLPEKIKQILLNPVYDYQACGGKPIDLPPSNKYIAKDLSLIDCDLSKLPQYPTTIKDDIRSKAYFKQDNKFKIPKTIIKLLMYTRDLNLSENCENFLLAKLWYKLFLEKSRELVYQAEMAKIFTKFYLHTTLEVGIEGFSETALGYAQEYFTQLNSFDPTLMPEEFTVELNKLQKKQQNYFIKPPHKQGKFLSQHVIRFKGAFHPQELLNSVQQLTFEKLCDFHKKWLKNVFLTWFIAGNITSQSALGFIEESEARFFAERTPLPRDQIEIPVSVNIKSKNITDFIWELDLQEAESNSYINSVFQFENSSIKNDMLIKLIENFLEEPFYSSLRTEQQLGYNVWSMTCSERTVLFVYFQIQSDVKPPQYLSQKIDDFIDEMLEEVEGMEEEDLETIKESVETDLREEPHSVFQEASRYWYEIQGRRLVFDIREKEIKQLKAIKLKDFQKTFASIFEKNRSNFQIHLVSKVHKEENEKLKASEEMDEETNQEFITDIAAFKATQPKHQFKFM